MSHSRLAAGACKAVYTSSILVGASPGTSANAEVPSSQRSTAPPAAPPAHLRERPYAWKALLRGLLCAGFIDRGLKGRARRRNRSASKSGSAGAGVSAANQPNGRHASANATPSRRRRTGWSTSDGAATAERQTSVRRVLFAASAQHGGSGGVPQSRRAAVSRRTVRWPDRTPNVPGDRL